MEAKRQLALALVKLLRVNNAILAAGVLQVYTHKQDHYVFNVTNVC